VSLVSVPLDGLQRTTTGVVRYATNIYPGPERLLNEHPDVYNTCDTQKFLAIRHYFSDLENKSYTVGYTLEI